MVNLDKILGHCQKRLRTTAVEYGKTCMEMKSFQLLLVYEMVLVCKDQLDGIYIE